MKTDEEFLSDIKAKYELASKKCAKTKKTIARVSFMFIAGCFICAAAVLTSNGGIYDESKSRYDTLREEKENRPAEPYDNEKKNASVYVYGYVKSGEEFILPADASDFEKITVTFCERKGGASEIYAQSDDGKVYLLRFSDGNTVIKSGRYELIVCGVEYLGDGKYSAVVISYAEA